ncbi:hypothetical protein [Opitutus sp. ER46]|uniref:hypothetical protein n=1 Tax=Opitutus sp. ER46 TaxID=2161864 RepID=UPI000D31C97E|nr:hypothetical protein [Opitutus sp. ER46]PTX95532.1 hypothetical protein DB354_08915 [Opitutus sp. ER46]
MRDADAVLTEPVRRPRTSRLWWWVGLAFALQLAAWTAWLILAAKNPVAEVPLATPSAPTQR